MGQNWEKNEGKKQGHQTVSALQGGSAGTLAFASATSNARVKNTQWGTAQKPTLGVYYKQDKSYFNSVVAEKVARLLAKREGENFTGEMDGRESDKKKITGKE